MAYNSNQCLTKCAAVLGTYAFAATKPVQALRVGSVSELVSLLVGGSFTKEKILAVAGTVLGIDLVISTCL